MSKTIREVANQLDISKQAVAQRMDAIKNFRDRYTSMVGHHIEITDKGVKILVNFGNETTRQATRAEQQEDTYSELKETIAILKSQIEVKDNQIDKKDDQLKTLERLLDQQQQLQLDTTSKYNKLKKQIEVNNDSSASRSENVEADYNKSNASDESKEDKPHSKHWWKFWHSSTK